MFDILLRLLVDHAAKDVVRPGAERLGGGPANPEACLSIAATLDQQGDWEAALKMYRYVVSRWPGAYDGYVANCVAAIGEKVRAAQS